MSNIIRLNEASPNSEWLVMSNQGTDCFLDLLISAAENTEQTGSQKELISFLQDQKTINEVAPGTAGFDVTEMPWITETIKEDAEYIINVITEAEKDSTFDRLPYEANKNTVIPWLKQFAGMIEQLKQDHRHSSYEIRRFEKKDIQAVLEFERELRRQEPDTYYWEPDEAYGRQLELSFEDPRFNTAMSFIAVKDDKVIGRIDASLIASRSDAACYSAYLDWICVLKSERHNQVAQGLLKALREECRKQGVGMLIALMASNEEALSFYGSIEGASIHDTGIWIEIKQK
ncbi:MAG: GNAT family N-acetyltransferase [Erysipelotrichaceae bacterium]|nr:GNAT family N-acetyltransferase [Erysipelotrichaceae bacterium]